MAAPTAVLGDDNFDFLSALADFQTLRRMLPEHVNHLARLSLESRQKKIALLSTPEAVKARKAYVREKILAALGSLPERTPLKVHLIAVLDRGDYQIEKFVFESQPRFYVTAHLYLPKRGTAPYPTILFPLGHEIDTKANATWQQMMGTLAKRGYVVLTYDPIGQGERVQLYDPDWEESKVFRNNTEHTILGIQCQLIGDNLVRYEVWDGIRALDYLVSRPEVDAHRIACTGNSGGGNLTALLAALDDRIQVAAPSCWISSWKGLLETIGQQDAEQVLLPSLKDGLDHADFIYAFAPKPYLVLSAIRDFFSIVGTRETYEEAKGVYTALGVSEKLQKEEADAGHNYSKPLRMAAYRWFGRWLKGVDDREPEAEVSLLTEAELWCTPTGQLQTSLGGETVFTLNQRRVEMFSQKPPVFAKLPDLQRFQEETRKQVRLLLDQDMVPAKRQEQPLLIQTYGQLVRLGYRVERLTYQSEPGILIPALLWIPETQRAKKPAVVYVDGRGKSAEAGPGKDLEQLVQAGFVVLAIDMRGTGETEVLETQQANDVRTFFGDYDSTMTALAVGKPLVGMRALDISRAVDLLQARVEVDPERVYGFGKTSGSVPLLYAATLDSRIKKVVLEDLLLSYRSIVNSRVHRQVFEGTIAGVLKFYDLPDLIATLAPREVWVVNGVNALGLRARTEEVNSAYLLVKTAFNLAGGENRLHLGNRGSETGISALYPELVSDR